MRESLIGLCWGLAFIVLESVQFVFFGSIFQRMSSFLFGSLVFGITTVVFVGWAAVFRPRDLTIAFGRFRLLLAINVTATLSWIAFLLSVQMIEPAVSYTLGAGAMPIAAYLAYRCGVREGEALRNRMEIWGVIVIAGALIYLSAITAFGMSGFVRGGTWIALLGTALALVEGGLFTWLLILCQRIDRAGVAPSVVFGLRFPLYALCAGLFAAAGLDSKLPLPALEIAVIVGIGLALIVPPLYALQRAVALLPTLTISALTALGPFVIFVLQWVEGRVEHSAETLVGLTIYFAGALLAAFGAARASVPGASAG